MRRHGRKPPRAPRSSKPAKPSGPSQAGAGLIGTLPLALRIQLQRIKPSTQQQYVYALNHFAQWLQDTRQDQRVDAPLLDTQLQSFAEHLFRTANGGRRQTAACARLACIWLSPTLKHRLPKSLAATNQTGWYREAGRVVQSHRPMPWALVCAVAHRLAAAGDGAMATAIIIGFSGLLRVGEVAALQVGDVADQRLVDARLPAGLVVTIQKAKTADEVKGEQQSVVINDAAPAALLREYWALRQAVARSTDSLFGMTEHELERKFGGATTALGGSTRFTWHSLRHGCATLLFMSGLPVGDICLRGRWRSLNGVERYVQTGRAVVAAHGVDPAVVAHGEAIADALRRAATAAW